MFPPTVDDYEYIILVHCIIYCNPYVLAVLTSCVSQMVFGDAAQLTKPSYSTVLASGQ